MLSALPECFFVATLHACSTIIIRVRPCPWRTCISMVAVNRREGGAFAALPPSAASKGIPVSPDFHNASFTEFDSLGRAACLFRLARRSALLCADDGERNQSPLFAGPAA
jgi:hypothetical protein